MDRKLKTEETKEAIREIKDEEGVKEVVYEVLDYRQSTCPYRDDIMGMKKDTNWIVKHELPFLRKMMWGVLLMLVTTFVTAFITLSITANNSTGLSIGELVAYLLNGGK